MLNFSRTTLANGLRVLVHEDSTTPLAAVNILYDVGSRDENPERTGFAHLFEHLMFGGSQNIPDYDGVVQVAGGENNAFTSNDITNYYLTLPAANLETAFWLESDRMMQLAFSMKSLDVQRNVVIEEFKQRYLNQPYGDVWLLMRPLVYKVHPYLWDTIGKNISHIEQASLADVEQFFHSHYCPDRAVLSVAGNVKAENVFALAEKWFGTIDRKSPYSRALPAEPEQKEKRTLEVKKKVPADAIYMAFHCCSRVDKEFHTVDLLTDVLSSGMSSRLYQSLVKEQKLFSEINAFTTAEFDKSIIMVQGKLSEGVKMEDAEKSIEEELNKIKNETIADRELQKVKNKVIANIEFSEIDIASRALNLAYYELTGDANEANKQEEHYLSVTADNIRQQAQQIFRDENCSVLYYYSES
ncbi:MAG TPA: pitrilysin family protein [Bacteroidia bacterium]|nr:pitrilysin family protein [Bacteroidia bacterium]